MLEFWKMSKQVFNQFKADLSCLENFRSAGVGSWFGDVNLKFLGLMISFKIYLTINAGKNKLIVALSFQKV